MTAIAMAVAAGSFPDAAAAAMPAEVVSDLAEEMTERKPEGDRRRFLQALARDPRPLVRSRITDVLADSLGTTRVEVTAWLGPLARDASPQVRSAAAHGLLALLHRADPLQRTEIACDWALSDCHEMRAAVAGSLASRLTFYLPDLLLDQLANDPDHRVRRAAAIALGSRWAEQPKPYTSLLLGLTTDDDRSVRRAARRMIGLTKLWDRHSA